MLFQDRSEAGRLLAEHLAKYAGRPDVVVLALPRGGVAVAFEVARALRAPLDIHGVRKLGLPGHPELAMGAIASGGVRVLNQDVVRALSIPDAAIEVTTARERHVMERRERAYHGGRSALELGGRTVILVDDGLATGSTMRAAVVSLRQQGPARVVVAVPVGAPQAYAALEDIADELVCAQRPEPFHAVGAWYADFSQTSDEEVRELIEKSALESGRRSGHGGANRG